MIRLCVRPRPPRADSPGLVPSLGAFRFLRRLHRYYEPVRLPTSARMAAPASPRLHPPPETNPADPVGPPCSDDCCSCVIRPSTPASDAISHSDGARAAFEGGKPLGLRDLPPFEAHSRTPHNPCLASDPALPRRPQDLVPACPLRLWPDGTFTHRHSSAFHDALPADVEIGGAALLALSR